MHWTISRQYSRAIAPDMSSSAWSRQSRALWKENSHSFCISGTTGWVCHPPHRPLVYLSSQGDPSSRCPILQTATLRPQSEQPHVARKAHTLASNFFFSKFIVWDAFYIKNSHFFNSVHDKISFFFFLKPPNPFVFLSLCRVLRSWRPGKFWLIWRLVNYSCVEGSR